MTCVDRQVELQELLNGELPPRQRKELEAHLQTCAACRQDLETYRLLASALPTLPEPEVPEDLPETVMAAVGAYRPAWWREREPASMTLARRSVFILFAAAFSVALGVALWGWAARIVEFAGRMISRDLIAVWGAARDLWSLITLLGEVARHLQPTAQNLWAVAQRAGEPLAAYGLVLVAAYAAALSIGAFLCWRALFHREGRRLSHAS